MKEEHRLSHLGDFGLSYFRPFHSLAQIMKQSELKKGMTLRKIGKATHYHSSVIELTSDPYWYEKYTTYGWRVNYRIWSELTHDWVHGGLFLSDLGIHPYKSGKWNTSNWLETV